MPVQTQLASIAAWNDEIHVRANRELYRAKFDAVLDILAPVMDAAPGWWLLSLAENADG